jgi:hypothetical protein
MTGEYAERERRPEPVFEERSLYNEPESRESLPGQPTGVNVGDYGRNVPAVRGDTLTDLPSPYAVERPEAKSTGSGRQGNDPKDKRIAQNLDGISYQEDPITGLIMIIIGGIVVGIGASLEAAKDIAQHIMRSQRGRQGDAGDTGIRNEAQDLVDQGKAKDIKDALAQLMREANRANNGKPDNKRKQRIKAEQKEQEARRSRESKDKPKQKKKK